MVALLDAPAGDVETLARDVLAAAWSMLGERTRYGLVLDQPGVGVTLHGPFDTRAQADKWLRGFPLAGPGRPRVLVAEISTTHGDTTLEGLE